MHAVMYILLVKEYRGELSTFLSIISPDTDLRVIYFQASES